MWIAEWIDGMQVWKMHVNKYMNVCVCVYVRAHV